MTKVVRMIQKTDQAMVWGTCDTKGDPLNRIATSCCFKQQRKVKRHHHWFQFHKPTLSFHTVQKMASLQHLTASIQSKHALIPRTTFTQKQPIRNLFLSGTTTFTSLKMKVTTTRRSNGALGARMSATVTASYASALLDVAKSNNTLDATATDIEKIDEIFSDPKVFDFFADPTVEDEKKLKLVDDVADSSGCQPHTRNFLYILVDSKRIDMFKEIAKEFESVYNSLTNTELAIVTSVVKLEPKHLAQIAKRVQKLAGAKNVRIRTRIDPSLVAGFTVRYGNSGSKLIDLSVRKQLEDMAAQLELGDVKVPA
ncbi:hypothetical protein VNO77_24821 [Canavalia gladiata]|uniref:ATP synthase peripheral stalk subunit OSCP n=1 Tax=Canavalia gladiata TaxID=3824 RepID=A0AAN9LCA1_CANGL